MRAETIGPPVRAAEVPAGVLPVVRRAREIAAEVATLLANMSFEERVRAYRSGALSGRELALGAAWFPEEMPLLNGEFEWIAIDLE